MALKKYYGIHQGFVTNLKDPEKRGRIKVICPTILGVNTESAWCDPVVPVAYDNGGDFCIPAKGEAVWLIFIDGNVNKPVWLGGWWSKNKTPLGTSYSDIDKVRIINYANCNIIMKDNEILLNVAGGDYDILIKNGEVSIKGNLTINGNISVNGDLSVSGEIQGEIADI